MPNIHHQLLIGATVEKVYSAMVTREGLSAWWTPDVKAEPEIGGIARFPFGPVYFKEMKITVLKPHDEVKWICIKGAGEWIGTTISFVLHPFHKEIFSHAHPEMNGQAEQQHNIINATLLVFHHDNWKGYTPMFAECNYTWGQFLRSLKLLCETGKGRPWPNQHRVEQ